MSDPQWRRGLKVLERLGLIYDFRVPYYHLKEGAEPAQRVQVCSSSSITRACPATAAVKA